MPWKGPLNIQLKQTLQIFFGRLKFSLGKLEALGKLQQMIWISELQLPLQDFKINGFIHAERYYTFRAKMKKAQHDQQVQGFNAAVTSKKPDRLFR